MSHVTFHVEHFRNAQPELAGLVRDHWDEIALDHEEVPLDVDWKRYYALADAGAISMVVARDAGVMVGYHIAMISGHLHYAGTLHGITDVYYLKPSHRKGFTGYRLFKAVNEEMKRLGVKKLVTATKKHLDIGVVLRRLGYRETETTFTKVLES